MPYVAPDSILALNAPKSWAIPSEEEVAEMSRVPLDTQYDDKEGFWRRRKHRYSAAATAIHFLSGIPHSVRLQIENILLLEDYESVARPESHMLGFIQFCTENPQLRVERRVNLWRTVLIRHLNNFELRGAPNPPYYVHLERRDSLERGQIGHAFGVWITEALTLFSVGMPVNSFSLVFDGDPAAELASQIFAILKSDAEYQVSMEEFWKEAPFTDPTLEVDFDRRRCQNHFLFEAFPQVVQDIMAGKSFIRCNFPVDRLWNVNELINKRPRVEFRNWYYRPDWRREGLPEHIQTSPPLPTWRELELEQLISEH